MGLRNRHVKKENPRALSSGLFGITDKAESTEMRNNEASFPIALHYKVQKIIQTAVLEAEYKKAQAIALTQQMRYM